MGMDFADLNEVRVAAAEDLCNAGQLLLSLREMMKDEHMQGMLPAWKWTRFLTAISEAAGATMRAMDCLKQNESPTTQALVASVITRWEKAGAKDREEIVAALRAAFVQESKK